MPIPICVTLPEIPDPFDLPLPGITISRINLMEILQALLAPLTPFFRIIDTIAAVYNCIKAIPDSIGPPPDPSALAACMPELAEKLQKLLELMPQVALPMMLIRIIDLLIDTLEQAKRELKHLQQQIIQILGVIDRARDLDDAGLVAIANCAQENVEQEAYNVGKALASIGRLIGLINIFMDMIGGPEIPDLSDLAGQPLDKVIKPIDKLIDSLKTARKAVPVP